MSFLGKIRNRVSHKKAAYNLAISVFRTGGGLGTSLSDNKKYPLLCYIASKDENTFRNFKLNRIYRDILEHVTQQQGQEYLDIIGKFFTLDDWHEFMKNDLYGEPLRFTYDIAGEKITISPTTIRYAKVLKDILENFNTGEIKSIAEIGAGYGGQCRLIRTKIPEAGYTLFDLPEVLGLDEKFLSKFENCRENIRYVDGGHIYIEDEYDLVISNYAFSELRREIQDMYLEKVILKSKRGYITWNCLSQNVFGGYSVNELLKVIPGSSRIEEKPLTHPDNCIIIWGNK